MLLTFINGLLIALAVEMPIGPIALLTMERSLTRGWKAGTTTGLASATVLAIFSIIAGVGTGLVMQTLQEYRTWLQLIGAIIVLTLGMKTLLQKKQEMNTAGTTKNASDYSSAFGIAISNPGSMLLFVGAFATFGTTQLVSPALGIVIMTIGVFLGSIGWWIFLSSVLHHAGKRLPETAKHLLQRVAGVLMIVIGIMKILTLCLS